MPVLGDFFDPNGFEHSRIPRFITAMKDLTSSAKLVYGELAFYSRNVGGLIYPSQEKIAEATGMSVHNVRFALNALRDRGLIKVIRPEGRDRLKHFHNRYVFVWVREAEKLLARCFPDSQLVISPESEPVSSASKHLILKTNTVSEGGYTPRTVCVRDIKKTKEINPAFRIMSKRLASAISQNRRLEIRKSKYMKWANHFSRLHEEDRVDITRMTAALDFYCDKAPLKLEYFPVVECGESFRKKFSKIERAMEKEKVGNGRTEEEFRGPVVHVVRLDGEISDSEILDD